MTAYTQVRKTESEESDLNRAAEEYLRSPTPENREAVVKASEGVIRHFSWLYGKRFDKDDLYQVGCIGVLKALEEFDPVRYSNVSFVTYAGHCIMGEIRHYVRKEMSFYSPKTIVKIQQQADEFVDGYVLEHGDVPDCGEVACHLNIREEGIEQLLSPGLVEYGETLDFSLVKTIKQENFTLVVEDKLYLENAFKKLSDIQKKVINSLFFKGKTQEETAKEFGLTQRQVSRIKDKSIQDMRDKK